MEIVLSVSIRAGYCICAQSVGAAPEGTAQAHLETDTLMGKFGFPCASLEPDTYFSLWAVGMGGPALIVACSERLEIRAPGLL